MKNLASKGPPKGPPMKNLVCNEKFGINCASAEAQFGTGRGIIRTLVFWMYDHHSSQLLVEITKQEYKFWIGSWVRITTQFCWFWLILRIWLKFTNFVILAFDLKLDFGNSSKFGDDDLCWPEAPRVQYHRGCKQGRQCRNRWYSRNQAPKYI